MNFFNNYTAAYLMVTSNCNLRCPYCYLHKKSEVMSKSMIENSINLLIHNAKIQNKQEIKVTFFGGEPTLYPDLCKYALLYTVNQCKINGLKPKFSMITNGMRFDEAVQDFLLTWHSLMGSFSIQLSYDGFPEIQRINRIAFNNAFDSGAKMIENITKMKEFCQKYNINFSKSFHVHSVISKKSMPYMFEIYKYFENLGLAEIFGLVVEDEWTLEDVKIYDEQFDKIFNYLKETNPSKLKSKIFGYNTRNKKFIQKTSPFRCGGGRTLCAITPLGDIYTCHRAAYNSTDCILGHVNEDGSFTTNEENQIKYNSIQLPEKCQSCNNSSCRVCKSFFVNPDHYGVALLNFDVYCKLADVEKKYSNLAQEYLKEHNMI